MAIGCEADTAAHEYQDLWLRIDVVWGCAGLRSQHAAAGAEPENASCVRQMLMHGHRIFKSNTPESPF